MTQSFGPGDYGGYNDWAFSGSGSFYTNWNSSTFATGIAGRITAVAARWDGYSPFCASTSGHNTVWSTGGNKVIATSDFAATARAAGTTETMHNVSCADAWTGNTSYFLGFSRTSTQCSIHAWADGAHGGYSGKSAVDTTNTGGTPNWGGGVNGGMPVFGTVTVSNIYVRRGFSWVNAQSHVRRSSAWSSPFVKVRRGGAWTVVNWLQETERHLPPGGMPVEVDVGEGWEQGWIVEEGEVGWFGNVDPTTQPFDWTKPGHYEWEMQPWTGRYNSSESEELAEARLKAMYEHDQAMRWERYDEAKNWYMKYQPPIIEKKVEDYDPILVGCNCGG